MKSLVRPGPREATLTDYVEFGAYEGLSSHTLLDADFYASQRPDIARALNDGTMALVHYRTNGAAEGVNPHPLFDTRFYLRQCPDALRPGSDPLSHYLDQGWRENLDPHPLFCTAYYLQRNSDVARAGINPLLHYVQGGGREGRETSPYFDATHYAAAYPDVVSSGLAPLVHFLKYGIALGRSAGPMAAFQLAYHRDSRGVGAILDIAAKDEQSYYAWIRDARRLSPERSARVMAEIAQFRYRSRVSILLHVTRELAMHAIASVESLLRQCYDTWQLCAVLDSDIGPATVVQLADIAAVDGRIQVIRRGTSEESCFALNTALDISSGDYVGLLRPGDRLHPLALSSLVGCLQGERRPLLVYGDEDTIDRNGFHFDPMFKPDWSDDLALGLDYISRASIVQTSVVRKLNGFRRGFETASDYDLFLRLAATLGSQDTTHVAHPLYHRLSDPALPISTASLARSDGMYRALKAHVDRTGVSNVVLRGRSPGHFRVAFELQGEPLVSVVIPTANASFAGPLGPEFVLDNCVRSLRGKTNWKALEIIVVHDGNLTEPQLAWLAEEGVILVEYDRSVFNFSSKVNMGVRASRGTFVLLLNDDIEAKRPDWLTLMLGWAQQPGVGVVGAKLFFPDGRLQHTGIVVQHGNPGHLYYRASGDDAGYLEMNDTPRNWLAVTGACQLVTRALFDEVGGYDESLPLNFNDVDFCLRIIDHGCRIVYVPQAELYHFEGISKLVEIGNQMTTPSETDFFQARWRRRYPTDPYYHPDFRPWEALGVCRPDDIRRTPTQARKLPAAQLRQAAGEGVNWLGPINRSSGLGTASRGYVSALQQAGFATRLVALDKIFSHQSLIEHSLVSTQQDFPITVSHANADLTSVLFQQYGEELARARYRIGLWVWELPSARSEWLADAKRFDELWVPSKFCETAFKAITSVPVTVIPHVLSEPPEFAPNDRSVTRAMLGLPDDAFVFLYMFDTFSFVDRKNPQCLLDAFEAEFTRDPNVYLVLKISYFENLASNYSSGNQTLLRKIHDVMARMPNVRVVSEFMPHSAIYQLMNAVDCYVSPHRSEGFGLTVAEAMLCGKPVIATDFGGTTDFVRQGTGFPLSYELVELAADQGPYAAYNIWANPSVEHLRELMRKASLDLELCQTIGSAARTEILTQFSPATVGGLIRRRIRSIAAAL